MDDILLAKLDLIYNHMILRDARDAGLIPDDLWRSMLRKQLNNMVKVEVYNGKQTEGSMV